ncbi:hypothetical protein BOTBODRAFT_214030 [Botryobasidium botryosum FD-172 SS1]|uniref:Uncharacterized protein n=1 Tax=Botryobasidium botryosum (strain FD-172 SS1) TaxID=930990 RepID=A0A067N4G0_BOTB1|nr:hypothetical protein BOTBODRAFT_214030 [Botryobasidium botryosum FD-172 SS1]
MSSIRLYHHNPWSDTAEDLSFAMFREQGASFFVQRFPGMTNEVAEFLADRVFCVVEDGDAAQRVTAQEFGLWAKRLPAMLADDKVFSPVVASRPSFMMTQDDSTAVEADRPAEQLPVAVPTGLLTPALASPQLPPVPLSDGPIAPLEDAAEDDPSSRAASTKRRKRGTRSKSKTVSSPAPIAPPELGAARDATLDDLAAGTQDLVREISRQSKGLPLPPPPPPPLPSNNLLAPPVPALPTPRPIPVKKPSKWNVFRSAKDLASSDAHAPSQPQPRSSTPEYEGNEFGDESTPRPLGMSATAANVSSLVMGLGPAPRAPRAPPSEKSEKGAWHRGRAQEQQPVHGRGLGGATSPLGARWTGNGNVSGGGGGAASGPDHRWPGSASASGPAQADNRSERYTPSVRSRGGLYGVTADNSSNWRQSYSSTSSVATSSAYTRFSNGSVRSLSTVATTVSTGSALRSVSSIAEKPEPPAPVPKRVHPPMPATNVKRECDWTCRA